MTVYRSEFSELKKLEFPTNDPLGGVDAEESPLGFGLANSKVMGYSFSSLTSAHRALRWLLSACDERGER